MRSSRASAWSATSTSSLKSCARSSSPGGERAGEPLVLDYVQLNMTAVRA